MKKWTTILAALAAALFLTVACGGGSDDKTDDVKSPEDIKAGDTLIDTNVQDDVTTPEDNIVPEDTTLPEDTTEPEDTTLPEDTTEPEDTTKPEDIVVANCSPEGNVANLKACAEGDVDVTVKGAVVTYVFDQGYFIQDDSGATEVYTTDTWAYDKVEVGQVIDIHATAYGSFHGQQEITASDAPVIQGTDDVEGFKLDLTAGTLPSEELESMVIKGTGFKVEAVDGQNLVVGYGDATGVTFRANEAGEAMCVGATFDVTSAIITQYDDEHRIQAFFADEIINVNTDNCEAPVEADDSNWGFEEGGANNPPADFEIEGGAITAEWTTEQAHTGSNGCKLTWTDTENQDFIQGYYMPITTGATATLSVWGIDNDAGGRFRLCLEFFNDTYMSVKKEYSSAYTEDSADWTELTYAIEAPENAAYVRGFVRLYDVSETWDGNATVYVDDWNLTVN